MTSDCHLCTNPQLLDERGRCSSCGLTNAANINADMVSRFIGRRQDAINSGDDSRQERLDAAAPDLLSDNEFAAYARAARAQDDALRARIANAPPPVVPFSCRVHGWMDDPCMCPAYTGKGGSES
jgi:hypothetical protein